MKKLLMTIILTMFISTSLWAKEIWYCPMHPNYQSDKAGTCPICGMNLVKKQDAIKQDAAPSAQVAGYVPVHIDAAKQQMMGVRTTKVERKAFTKTIRAVGSVAHDFELYQSQLEYISAWQQYFAFVARRPVNNEFRQDWREYYANNKDKRVSEDVRKAQERLIKAEYELRHMGLTTDELAKLREVKYGRPWVNPSMLFFSEEHPYWVYAEIFENDLGFIDVGQKAQVSIPAYGRTVQGVVRAVAESVDPVTRTVRVRIELPKSMIELKEGMFVNVTMPVELDHNLLVPRDAIMMTGTRSIAFVQAANGTLTPREVETGFESDGVIEIKKGLSEGELVVSGANFLVDSESRLQAALEGTLNEGASHE